MDIKTKKMKYYIVLLFLALSLNSFSQQVTREDKVYEVKKEKIFLNGDDVTSILKLEDKTAILKEATLISEMLKAKEKFEKNAAKDKKAKEKEAKKLEKEVKKKEKAIKKKEKAIKKKEKAKKNFEKAEEKLKKAVEKRDKLKNKGKLSPNDEVKWSKKIDKLNWKLTKSKQKL